MKRETRSIMMAGTVEKNRDPVPPAGAGDGFMGGPSPATSPPPASGAVPTKPRRRRIPFAIAGLVVVAMAGLGIRQWRFSRTHVSTDDAQIQGDVIPVLPKVGGFVADVRVRENQPVRAGDTLVVLDDRDLAAKLAQAEADLAEARAAVGTAGRAGQ